MKNDIQLPRKRLYFNEVELVIYFPPTGNEGRSITKYGVRYRNFKDKEGQDGRAINLEDVFALSKIKENYPHTICYFFGRSIAGKRVKTKYPPKCIEQRKIQDENDLFNWINELNL